MTNAEKYKGAKERAEAFKKCYHDSFYTGIGPFDWLDLEAEADELLPCPFCGRSTHILTEKNCNGWWFVHCYSCDYRSMACEPEDYAIAAHNRVARAAKEKEVSND